MSSASHDPSEAGSEAETALAREVYWAQDEIARSRQGTSQVRDGLHDLAAQLRADERLLIPQGEGNLASPSRWRRKLKYQLWRVLRPATRRYDRLIADHAELTAALADRVLVLEAELEQLDRRGDEDPAP